MTRPLQGLRAIVNPTPELTAEQRYGGTADPKHAIPGETATPYPWEVFPGETHGPYGADNQLLGDDDWCVLAEPAGSLSQDPTADLQPRTNAAPWPKGVPTTRNPNDPAVESWQAQRDAIHGSNMGASRKKTYDTAARQDQWAEISETDPGMSAQDPAVPGQVKATASGWGNTDRAQSFARQNRYGFDAAHMHRRYATGSIPGNYMWMQPGERPLVKSLSGVASTMPVGADSPFAGQVPGEAYDTHGSVLYDLPAAYVAPPEPALASSYPAGDAGSPDVELW